MGKSFSLIHNKKNKRKKAEVGQHKKTLKHTRYEEVCRTCYRNGLCAFVHVAKPLHRWVQDNTFKRLR